MLSDEEVRQHRLAADGCNLNGCSHVEALLTDRAELVAEIERLREALRDCIRVLVVFDTDTDRIIAIEHVVNTALEAPHA